MTRTLMGDMGPDPCLPFLSIRVRDFQDLNQDLEALRTGWTMGRESDNDPLTAIRPDPFLAENVGRFTEGTLPGPVLDLACGDGRNGIFLAGEGLPVVCCDRSQEALERARKLAQAQGVDVEFRRVDLEQEGTNPLAEDFFGGVLVFRYLYRPLIPSIRRALKRGGVLMYETFTIDQPRFGKPHNPDYLLNHGELQSWFEDWEVMDSFEGILEAPRRAMARILCRKPKERTNRLESLL